MSRKRYKPEQIINLLTEALIANSVIIFGRSNVSGLPCHCPGALCIWLIREVPTTSAPRPVYLQQPTFKPHVCFPPDCFRSTPSSGRGRHPRKMTGCDPKQTNGFLSAAKSAFNPVLPLHPPTHRDNIRPAKRGGELHADKGSRSNAGRHRVFFNPIDKRIKQWIEHTLIVRRTILAIPPTG